MVTDGKPDDGGAHDGSLNDPIRDRQPEELVAA
jgi:hypothetical protein